MSTGRFRHTATLLPDGKVLVAGGSNSEVPQLATCELYDPNPGVWTGTGSLNTGREVHSANLLRNGSVLVAGGLTGANGLGETSLASAELYNIPTGTWSTTDSMNQSRAAHVATLLLNGRLLVTGGIEAQNSVTIAILASAELYHPRKGKRDQVF